MDAQGADAGEERHPPEKSKFFENLQKMKFLKSDCMMYLVHVLSVSLKVMERA